MKITCIKGSPRSNGNSATIAAAFLKEAHEVGAAQITTFELNRLRYRGCQACLKCNTELDRCACQDDLSEVLDHIRHTDVLVLASSVFYGELTAQLKGLIDRMYSFAKYDYATKTFQPRLSGKQMVMVLSQGHEDENMFADIFPRYNRFFEFLGFCDNRLIRGCGLTPYDAPGLDVLEQARQTARQIVNSAESMSATNT
jgi:multimeric flavodoxin WrbA